MITLIAAAVLAAQPAPPGPQLTADHKAMDCCKDCCKDMAKNHEGHDMSGHQGHSDH
jgi:hypothetical protein